MAIGTGQGMVQLWDVQAGKNVRTMQGHTGRVGAMAWNEWLLSTGSRDRSIMHRDVRAPGQPVRRLTGHRQEVRLDGRLVDASSGRYGKKGRGSWCLCPVCVYVCLCRCVG